MIATNSATLLRAAGVFFTVKLCDLGDAHIQAMCGAIWQRRKKILNFASQVTVSFVLSSDLSQTVKFRSKKKACMARPRRPVGFYVAGRAWPW